MEEVKKYNSYDSHIGLESLISLYEGMLKKGQIRTEGAGNERLQQLYQKRYHYRKWANLPYAKRRNIISPLKV